MSLTYSDGEELALSAMKKEFKRLSRLAEKATAEYDEYINIGSELVAIQEEFARIVNAKEHGHHIIQKLESLQARRKKAMKILDKDLLKLIDKQHLAEIKRDSLGSEIQRLEFRRSLR
jgi:hypothetical protein